MRLVVIPQGIRRVLPALVNQFIAIVKDSSLVYFLGLLADPARPLPRRPGRSRPLRQPVAAASWPGLFYLVITVPLTHLVNSIDKRLRTGRRADGADAADERVDELDAASPLITRSNT